MLWSMSWPIFPYVFFDILWVLSIILLLLSLMFIKKVPYAALMLMCVGWLILCCSLLWRVVLARYLICTGTNADGQFVVRYDSLLENVVMTVWKTVIIPIALTFAILARSIFYIEIRYLGKLFILLIGIVTLVGCWIALSKLDTEMFKVTSKCHPKSNTTPSATPDQLSR